MSMQQHYLPYVQSLYEYLEVRVRNDLTLINAERQYEGLNKLELTDELIEEVIVRLLNYIHDTEEFADNIEEIIHEVMEVEA